jgi:Na+/H+ antiporter NhaD/arsenite permease-like protein
MSGLAPGLIGPAGVPIEFLLFAATLIGIVVLHRHTLAVALAGLAAITLFKLSSSGFAHGAGLAGLAQHFAHEWVLLANLMLLLLGFALLTRHFEASGIPDAMPAVLPDDWKGGLVLLAIVGALSSILDNIAAALIGGTIAKHVFRGKVHIGYLAAIVAASNAGGAGSVVGDTTTTMMWLDGVSPLAVVDAYVASAVALVVCGIPASLSQQRFPPIVPGPAPGVRIDWTRLAVVLTILLAAIASNVVAILYVPELPGRLPVIGIAVWAAILLTVLLRRPDWQAAIAALPGTIFLLALVASASMMPVERLPAASWPSTLGLGFVSAVFDNIPLTALALRQGGYDWGFLAFAVGFGGSMIWFGSSAGVALANMYPYARPARDWLRHGWHVAVAYVAGFFVMLLLLGWSADAKHRNGTPAATTTSPAQISAPERLGLRVQIRGESGSFAASATR